MTGDRQNETEHKNQFKVMIQFCRMIDIEINRMHFFYNTQRKQEIDEIVYIEIN